MSAFIYSGVHVSKKSVSLLLIVVVVISVFSINHIYFSTPENAKFKLEDYEVFPFDPEYEINKLKTTSESHKKEFLYLQEDLEKLRREFSRLEAENSSKKYAQFNLSEDASGFQTVFSTSGFFFVSVHSATQYLSGYKVVFSIGNPSFARYENVKIKVKWNRSVEKYYDDADFKKKYDLYKREFSDYLANIEKDPLANEPERPERPSWSDAFKTMEFSPLKPLNPGQWNLIELHLSPAQLEELEHVEVFIETPVVVMNKSAL